LIGRKSRLKGFSWKQSGANSFLKAGFEEMGKTFSPLNVR
jgi:hypothetical protein